MNNKISIVFFGSFLHYSAYVLQDLLEIDYINVVGVVTTPPLVDKNGEHKNPVHVLAEKHSIPVFTPETLNEDSLNDIQLSLGAEPVLSEIEGTSNFHASSYQEITDQARDDNLGSDLFLTAGYGKLLPVSWLEAPKIASLNLHLSVLPNYRGANPGEWALLMGENTSGVTLIEMSPQFDTGNIIATYTIPIDIKDTRETLYDKLYAQGATILEPTLAQYLEFKVNNINATELQKSNDNAIKLHLPPLQQQLQGYTYARRLKREDGFINWEVIEAAMQNKPISNELHPALYTQLITNTNLSITEYIERATRALAGFPSLWTEIQTNKGVVRMKILEVSIQQDKLILEKVHIAGKQPAKWNEVKNVLA